MTQDQMRLTPLEETKALIDAGLSPDMDQWSEDDLTRATEVLDKAQRAKIDRLNIRRKS